MKIAGAFLILLFALPAAAADCRGDLASSAVPRENEARIREVFIAEFADLIFAGEEQNQAWIDDVLNPLAQNDIHIMMENSWMKKLNDKILKNKDLVTALTNFHKRLFLDEIAKIALPLKTRPYQDFKSTRLTIKAPAGAARLAELETAFTNANQRFYASPRLKGILRVEDIRESWFRMGIGQTEAQAALAARDARDHGGEKGVSYFWEARVIARLNSKLLAVQAMHGRILEKLGRSPLLARENGWTGLHLEVFAAARKATPADFLATLTSLFPTADLKQEDAALILRFTEAADEFSPSVLVAKREHLTIHDAPFGAISMDFIGLGAENLSGTVMALAKAKDLHDAVRLTRENESKVTAEFNKRKFAVRSAVEEHFGGLVSVRFSGDDGIIIPEREVTLRDQLFLIQRLSRLLPRPFFRMAMINAEGAANAGSSELITHGESMEKVLRHILLRDLGTSRLNDLSLGMFIPDTGNYRKVFLIMGAKNEFTEAEKKILRNAFPAAVKIVESQVRAQGLPVEYDPTEIFSIFGKTKK